MSKLRVLKDPSVDAVFKRYPGIPRKKLKALRQIIIEAAQESEDINQLEETLKWGEPSYLTKHGSTIRIDWKEKLPEQYALYFKCTSKLVPTFKKVFGDSFTFESNRAIVFQMNEKVSKVKLKECIKTALHYHKVKHLPWLGLKT